MTLLRGWRRSFTVPLAFAAMSGKPSVAAKALPYCIDPGPPQWSDKLASRTEACGEIWIAERRFPGDPLRSPGPLTAESGVCAIRHAPEPLWTSPGNRSLGAKPHRQGLEQWRYNQSTRVMRSDPGMSLDRILYRSSGLTIGAFNCPRQHPAFQDSGPAGGDLIVFPRHAVYIKHPGRQAILADQRVVTLYNQKQHYRREAVAEYGDYSVWFHFPRARLISAMESAGWTHAALERAPFLVHFGRIENPGFLRQRMLHEYLRNQREHDRLLVEETASLLLADLLRAQNQNRRVGPGPSATARRQRDQVAHCLEIISRRWDQSLKLDALAEEVACSPFHLARIFKKFTGRTIHQSLLELRLRNGLDEMLETPNRRLTDLSLDSGFATPSHFTQQFRRAFGASPDRIRRSARRPGAWPPAMGSSSSAD